jgi:hypothetical protein
MRRWFRYLWLAWSAFSLVASLFIIALWIRSYWWLDYRFCEFGGNSGVFVHSLQGQLRVILISEPSNLAFSVPSEGTGLLELWRETFGLPNSPHRIPAEWAPDHSNLRKFAWTRYPDGQRFVVPDWFLAVLCGVLAGAPWVRRFSLRSLLITMTVLAVFLGVVMLS